MPLQKMLSVRCRIGARCGPRPLSSLRTGRRIVASMSLTALADLPAGHKVAITAIGEGGAIVKYGESIGEAAEDIAAGDWVHTHNIKPAK